jgi:hypothetical protein
MNEAILYKDLSIRRAPLFHRQKGSQDSRADLPDLRPGDKFGTYRSFEQGRADSVISLHAAK